MTYPPKSDPTCTILPTKIDLSGKVAANATTVAKLRPRERVADKIVNRELLGGGKLAKRTPGTNAKS